MSISKILDRWKLKITVIFILRKRRKKLYKITELNKANEIVFRNARTNLPDKHKK